jgi:flagellum-specific ATP synthase
MADMAFDRLRSVLNEVATVRDTGRIAELGRSVVVATGLDHGIRFGDRVLMRGGGVAAGGMGGEVIGLASGRVTIMPEGPTTGLAVHDTVTLSGASGIAPDQSWIGRVIDPFGQPLDGRPLMRGAVARPLTAAPPAAATRRVLGARLETGLAAFNTVLPLVRGQRIGLFAGSGVGKSSLLAALAKGVAADVIVIALIGERGREVREFVETVLGPAGMARSVIVAATSDQSALMRRRCAWTAMTVAEHFRDAGQHVLFVGDSVTRFAEAHREIALASGEAASLRGFPPSTSHQIMSLAERAGPGPEIGLGGDITAVFSVLVAGSDMDEPVADILRGTLDGHVVLDRAIAERGRYPAIDLLRSVSRSLPDAASDDENTLIRRARHLLGVHDRSEMMIRAGLYVAGSDPVTDAAIRVWPALDSFLAESEVADSTASFERLAAILDAG